MKSGRHLYPRAIASLALFSLTMGGCHKNDDPVEETTPVISSFTPAQAPVGATVVISGTHFNTDKTKNIVAFNGTIATVTDANTTTLSVQVPEGATDGKISLRIGDKTVTTTTGFKVNPSAPVITAFSPDKAPEGTTITLTGANFSTNKTDNVVLFGTGAATAAEFVSATATELVVMAPAAGTNGKVSVTVAGMKATSSGDFTYLPAISGFSPDYGERNSEVTITGKRFDADAAVTINGITAVINSQSANSIKIRIPADAAVTGGKITITGASATLQTKTAFQITNIWVTAPMSVAARYSMVGTVVDDVLYYGSGYSLTGMNGGWHSLNLKTGIAADLAPFPVGNGIAENVVFHIGNDIYCGGGVYYDATVKNYFRNQKFMKYNITANTWTEVAPYPGSEPAKMAAFVLGSDAYVGLGYPSNGSAYPVSGKFYKYTPNSSGGTWTAIADFGNDASKAANQRTRAIVFCDGNRAFVGGGEDGNFTAIPTFYEYIKGTNSWTPVAPCPGYPVGNGMAAGNKFYVVNNQQQLYSYDPAGNAWQTLPGFPQSILNAVGFGYNGSIYQAGGILSNGSTSSQVTYYVPNR